MSEMVVRVARAIQPAYDDMPPRLQDAWRGTARLAIEAMAEPTDGMVSAAQDAVTGYVRHDTFETMFRAAIAAALAEPGPAAG